MLLKMNSVSCLKLMLRDILLSSSKIWSSTGLRAFLEMCELWMG